MKIIEGIEQGSKPWHDLRADHIGASDVATILMLDPFKGVNGAFGLWLEKTGQKAPWKGNEATAHGHDNENEARLAYAAEVGDAVVPMVAVCDTPGFEFLMCSLDGWREESRVCAEIKCPIEAGTFREAKEGTIPEHYQAQIQTQLFVTGAARADYYCWFRGEGVLIPVEFDKSWWDITIAPEVQEFWRRVQAKDWPKPVGELQATTDEFNVWAAKMAAILQNEREIAARKQDHIRQGTRQFFANYAKISGGGIEVQRVYKRGGAPVSYTTSPQLSTTIRRVE